MTHCHHAHGCHDHDGDPDGHDCANELSGSLIDLSECGFLSALHVSGECESVPHDCVTQHDDGFDGTCQHSPAQHLHI